MVEELTLKSAYKIEQENRDLQIYERFTELMKTDGAQVLEVNKVVMAEFGIHSASTVWLTRKRVEARLKKKSKF